MTAVLEKKCTLRHVRAASRRTLTNEKGRQHVPAFVRSDRSQQDQAWLAISLPSADCAAARRAIGTRYGEHDT